MPSERPGMFDARELSGQLKCNGVLEAIRVTRSGFSHRFLIPDFLKAFGFLLLTTLDEKQHQQQPLLIKNKVLAMDPLKAKEASATLLAKVLTKTNKSDTGKRSGGHVKDETPATNSALLPLPPPHSPSSSSSLSSHAPSNKELESLGAQVS
jgi:hypothetical protein